MEAEANEDQARESERQGREKARVKKEEASRMRGTQRAGYGASGVDIGYGSPQQIMLETLANSVREQEAILAGARSEARTYRQRAKIARISAIGEAVGTGMRVAGSMGG
jgi:hypothetical protein